MKNNIFALFLLVSTLGLAQENSMRYEDLEITKYVHGTLLRPAADEKVPLVILIQGSGALDRNGNQAFMKNDYLKKLALALEGEGIASFRYDKRVLRSPDESLKEENIRFQDFITDASSVISHFEQDTTFSKLIVLGHSQGSLVGMVAARNSADAYISVAGVAQPIDSVITQQIASQVPGLKENVQQTFKEIRNTGSSSSYNPVLETVFRPSLQPFMLSWMQYDPAEEVAKLEIPVLIINGSKDLQVEESEATKLKEAQPDAELVIIEKMNHILRKIEGSDLENSKSYNEAGNPLHPELITVIKEFVKRVDEL